MTTKCCQTEPTQSGNSPEKSRIFSENSLRWLNILLRTAHLAVAGIFAGGCYFLLTSPQLISWHHLTILSGCSLVVVEFVQDKQWLHRGKGLMACVHLLLAILAHFFPHLLPSLLILIIVTGSIGSHMPRRFRHWSILYGKEQKITK